MCDPRAVSCGMGIVAAASLVYPPKVRGSAKKKARQDGGLNGR